MNRDRGIWNARDSAADNYPFMVLTCVLTDRPMFQGRMLDRPRHKDFLHLPLDYPRLNQFPEWFTAEAEKRYIVRDVASPGKHAEPRGAS